MGETEDLEHDGKRISREHSKNRRKNNKLPQIPTRLISALPTPPSLPAHLFLSWFVASSPPCGQSGAVQSSFQLEFPPTIPPSSSPGFLRYLSSPRKMAGEWSMNRGGGDDRQPKPPRKRCTGKGSVPTLWSIFMEPGCPTDPSEAVRSAPSNHWASPIFSGRDEMSRPQLEYNGSWAVKWVGPFSLTKWAGLLSDRARKIGRGMGLG